MFIVLQTHNDIVLCTDLIAAAYPRIYTSRMKKGKEDIKKFNLAIEKPYYDEFLQTMTKIFHWLRWLGIAGSESFVWKVWGLVMLVLLGVVEGEAIWKVIKALAGWAVDTANHRSLTARLAGTMFYASAILGLVQCWRLSSSWKEISNYWASVEWVLNIKFVVPDKTLKRRMYKVVIVVTVCATFEHVTDIIATLEFDCTPSLCLRKYILKSHGFMILDFEYSDWIAAPLLVMSIIARVLWNLQDLIIILTSMGLTSRYQRLNRCVKVVATKKEEGKNWNKDTEFVRINTWRKIREAYVKQAMLVRRVDSCVDGIILFSTFFNFYFICLQMFLGIIKGVNITTLKGIHYGISLAWLCSRTAYTVLAAADVNKYSKLASPYLNECQEEFYNIEIERLEKQLSKDYIALTGMGFFSLNRTVILQMAATVVTYVLVMIQYDPDPDSS